MGRKSEKAGTLKFDGFLYSISLFLVLRLSEFFKKKCKTPKASKVILAETKYFISSRKKKKPVWFFFSVCFSVDLKSVICDSVIHTDLTESLN